jgi:hypothetical protein
LLLWSIRKITIPLQLSAHEARALARPVKMGDRVDCERVPPRRWRGTRRDDCGHRQAAASCCRIHFARSAHAAPLRNPSHHLLSGGRGSAHFDLLRRRKSPQAAIIIVDQDTAGDQRNWRHLRCSASHGAAPNAASVSHGPWQNPGKSKQVGNGIRS